MNIYIRRGGRGGIGVREEEEEEGVLVSEGVSGRISFSHPIVTLYL